MSEQPMDYAGAAVAAWRDLHPDLSLAAYDLALRLVRAGRIAESSFDRTTRDHGFDVPGDFEVLSALRRAHPSPLRPQDLADRVMISAPGMTGRLDRLESAGYIRRLPHPEDRRATLVELTPEGIEAADETLRDLATDAEALFGDYPPPRRRALTDSLRKLMLILGDLPRDA